MQAEDRDLGPTKTDLSKVAGPYRLRLDPNSRPGPLISSPHSQRKRVVQECDTPTIMRYRPRKVHTVAVVGSGATPPQSADAWGDPRRTGVREMSHLN